MPPLTDARKKFREGRVTASIVPAIVGVDPWCSPLQAYRKILGLDEDAGGEAAHLGSFFEDGVLRMFEHRTGQKIKKRNIWRVGLGGELGATLDAETDDGAIVECKTTGLVSRGSLDEWGEDGTDEVPERVIVQVAAQMIAAPEKRTAFVPALLGGVGFRVYKIGHDARLVASVCAGVKRFIADHLEPQKPPAPDHRDLELVQAFERRADITVPLPEDLVEGYLAVDAQYKALEERRDAIRAQILEAMKAGDEHADAGSCRAGRVTYRRTKDSLRFDAKKLQEAEPAVWNKYASVVPGYRRFLVTAAKGGAA